ncbi:hypothetical protein Strain138_000129 [Pseudogemmatithrix spongiicola]|uniref:Uncharacterized protein n=1 Tax=Pseudogemmatithrix spongiicola TaxID=3062599 RepID=A0AA49JS02_9BACT|nr:hypothetical protein Strain138_000129 [Gemmatimonadaceae bacterium 'strain 138']WKW13805.1 hypothetical protein Strain318_000129 [Gemmatimonadaceae bacterium 'strain 318']
MMSWIVLSAAVIGAWALYRRTRVVPCTIDLESHPTHLHAHVELKGYDVHEGDEVLVHNAPNRVKLVEKRVLESTATVKQASWPRRVLVRVLGTSGITELYEVGFEG